MSEASLKTMLSLATEVASDAAAIALAAVGRVEVRRKADRSVVTDTDFEIQERIVERIVRTFPDHAIIAEETLACPGTHPDARLARYCWVIDPLDGTRNFCAGFPCFATSIAVLERGAPIVALVAEHNLGVQFTATLGQGARLDGAGVRVIEPEPGEDLLLGVPSTKDPLTLGVLTRWLSTRGLILRNLGSTATHLAMVASGQLAGAFGRRAKIWDVAAGALLVREAGGVFTGPTGSDLLPFALDRDPGEDIPFIAASPAVHKRLVESVRDLDR